LYSSCKLYMFRTVSLSIIRSFSLYTQQWYMSYSLRAGSGRTQFLPDPAHKLSANLYDIYHCCVYSEKTPDDGQRNCPNHVVFYSKNKFEKLVHLVGFIIGILSCYWINTFSPTVPPFAARISHVVADVQAPGGESGNV